MYTGRGNFFRRMGRWGLRGLGGMAGGLLGVPGAGSAIGGALGDKLLGSGRYYRRRAPYRRYKRRYSRRRYYRRGRGAYGNDVDNTNALMDYDTSGTQGQTIAVGGTGDEMGTIVISNKEYITDIYGPGVPMGPPIQFQNNSFPLNPGLAATFPLLSQIACNYDSYEFIQLIFKYRSTTTDIGTTSSGQVGTVCMATNYNAASKPFPDKQTMNEYVGAYSAKLTENLTSGVECDPNKYGGAASLYTRNQPVQTNQDIKTYDHGLFNLAVANSPAGFNGQTIGELWVEYVVKLRQPKLYSGRGFDIACDTFITPSTGGSSGLPPTNTAWNPAPNWLAGQQNSIGCQLSSGVNNTLILWPAGTSGTFRLRLVMEISGTVGGSQVNFQNVIVSNTGNISGISNYYVAGSAPTTATYMNTGAVLLTINSPTSVYETDIQVTQATGGTNNQTLITIPNNIATGVTCQWQIVITQINNVQGATGPNQPQVYVLANGAPITNP